MKRYCMLPYRSYALKSGKIMISGYLGGWTTLTGSEQACLSSLDLSKNLFGRLENAGILVSKDNLPRLLSNYRMLNKNLFLKPTLHMLNVTDTCNYRCDYCQAGVSKGKGMMDLQTAKMALDFIFASAGENISIEFQGGEPLINWPVVHMVTKKARQLAKKTGKSLHLCIVSNLSLLDADKLDFLANNNVSICTSLDGDRDVHDQHRKSSAGHPTFEMTSDRIRQIREKKMGLWALCTVTRHSLGKAKEIIDAYAQQGISMVHLRPLEYLGDAVPRWEGIRYTAEEFFEFWKTALQHITGLNRSGKPMLERGAHALIMKLLLSEDPMLVEQMSPTGLGRSMLLYNFDGSIYNSDEGRMLSEPLFRIGDVRDSPEEVICSESNISLWASSFMGLYSYGSAFGQWSSIHPVLAYQEQGTVIPIVKQSLGYRVLIMQMEHLADLISRDGEEKELFYSWMDFRFR